MTTEDVGAPVLWLLWCQACAAGWAGREALAHSARCSAALTSRAWRASRSSQVFCRLRCSRCFARCGLMLRQPPEGLGRSAGGAFHAGASFAHSKGFSSRLQLSWNDALGAGGLAPN